MTVHTKAITEKLIDPRDLLQLALDVDAVPHHPLDERLHDYQRRAVAHLHAHPRAALFIKPGGGKTAITLSALTEVHLPAVVIAPKRVIEETWPKEIAKWRPDLTYSLVRGRGPVRLAKLRENTDIHLITWDTFSNDIHPSRGRTRLRYKTVILDELSKVKGRGVRWKHAAKLVRDVPYVIGLTGTPAPNSLMDLWPQLFLLDRGARLGRTITAFRTQFFRPGKRVMNGIITEWTLLPGAKETIYSLVDDICMSLPTSVIDYPERLDTYHWFDLPRPAKRAYEEMKNKFVVEIAETLASVEHAAAKTNKLSQIANGFMYHTGLVGVEESDQADTTHFHMEKMKILRDILDDAQGEPTLVFYRYDEDRRRLLQLDGAVDIKTPNAIERWNRGNIPILIAHPASAGHGLNLQKGGSIVVWYGMTWSSEEYDQGIGRLVRPGQPSPVVAVHHILAKDTTDELMLEVVQGRISRQEALLKVLEK